MPQHRSSTVTPGPMPACTARARISPAVMKLSCPTNSPGAYADTRARCSARSNGARSSCLMAVLPAAPSAPDLAAAGAGKVRRRASVRINVSPRRTHDSEARCEESGGPGDRADRPGAAARRPGGDRRARRGRLGRRRRLRRDHGGGAGARPRAPSAVTRLGPASWVTLARATLAVGVAALVADSFAHDTPVALLVTLAAVALALDAVDGWLARRTGTASALGARFDGEVDAFLILALSVYVAPAFGAWVLAIGAARYLFLAGEWLLPWMRAPLPPRRWRKVVAAAQGIVLTVAAAERAAPGAHAGAPGRRARRAGGVGRRVRVVAVAPPATPCATGAGGVRRSARARAAARGHRRGAHGRSPCCSSGPPSSRRTSRATHARRVRAAAPRAPRRRRPGRRCCPPPRAACWPWSPERCWRCSWS